MRGFPEDLQDLLLQLEKDHIIERYYSDDENFGMHSIDKALLLKALNIFSPKSKQSIKCVRMFKDHFILPHITYLPFKLFFERLNSPIASLFEENISSPGEKPKKKGDRRGSSGEVHPPSPADFIEVETGDIVSSDIQEIPFPEVAKKIKKPQEEIGIWISKKNLDHVKTWNGKYDLNIIEHRNLFNKLEEHFQMKYNETGWAYPVKEEDGYLLKVHVHQNPRNIGTIRFIAPRSFDYQTLFQGAYFKIFNFLTPEEHQVLLEGVLNEETGSKLFYIELANAIGPKKIVDKKLKGAKLSCRIREGAGGKTWVDVQIDYSDPSAPEIEFKGKHEPTALTRDLVVDAFKVADSIMGMKKQIVNNQHHISEKMDVMGNGVYENGQVLQLLQNKINFNQQEILADISELNNQYFGLDIKTDINHVETRQAFKGLNKGLIGISRGLQGVTNNLQGNLIFLDKGFQDLKDHFDMNISGIDEEFSIGLHDISSKIDVVSEKIDKNQAELKAILNKEFKNASFRIKNALYLILRKIDMEPGITIKKLQAELSIPRSTLVGYINKLHAKKFIDNEFKKIGRRGRPPKLFKSTQKIKSILKKINQSQKEE